MPYKDLVVRRNKAKEYQRKYKENMSLEKREMVNRKAADKRRIDRNAWLNSLSPENRQAYYNKRNEKNRQNYATDLSIREKITKDSYNRYHQKRAMVIDYLGGRCSSPDCKWVNDDGTPGCTDRLCLQVDHVKGDGRKRRKAGENGSILYLVVLKTVPGEEYQLLCANCNWIKRHINKEVPKSRFNRAA